MLSCLCLSGCRDRASSRADEGSEAAGEQLAAAPAELITQLTTLGDRGVLVVVLRDAEWRDSAGALLESLGGDSKLAVASSPVALLRSLLEQLEIPVRAGELQGRDANRPIVASLFEAPIDGPMTAATALQPLRAASHVGMREQVRIPASDAAALLASLGELLGELEPWPELIAGRADARAWRIDDGFLAALPEGDIVRVVVMHGAHELDLAGSQAQLDAVPVTPADTPALRHFGQLDAGAALLLRPWRIRGAMSWEGLYHGRRALHDSPPDQREQVIARATELVLGGELLMPDEGAEFDDWAVTVSRRDGVASVRAVASATELGQRVLAAAHITTPVGTTFGGLSIEQWLSLERGRSVATGSPIGMLEGLRPGDAVELWRNCGRACPIHAALRMPFGTAGSSVGALLHMELAQLFERGPNRVGAVRIAAAGPALTIELVLDDRSKLAFAPDFTGMQWPSPMRAAAASPGDACIARAGLAVRQALASSVTDKPEQRVFTMVAPVDEHADDFRCAIEHPPTAEAAIALRRMAIETAAQAELARLAFKPGLGLLDKGCRDFEDPQLCDRWRELGSLPHPVLASSPRVESCLPALEQHFWEPGVVQGLPLYVTDGQLALADRGLVRDEQDIAMAIVDRSTDGVAPLALVVDRNAELASLAPVLLALGALEVRSVALVTRDAEDRIYSVPLGFRGPKSFAIALPKPAYPSEDEPPPEDPPPGDEPPPRRKSGLYDMKGPGAAIPQLDDPEQSHRIVLELDGTNVTLTRPEAPPEQLTLEQLTKLPDQLDGGFIELRVSDTTPWSSVVTLATNVCPLTVTLAR